MKQGEWYAISRSSLHEPTQGTTRYGPSSWLFATLKGFCASSFDSARKEANEYTAINSMQKPNSLLIGFRLALKEEGKELLGASESLLSSAARPSTKEQFPTRPNKMMKDCRPQKYRALPLDPHPSNEEGML
jgi:hypothetical protein